MVSHGHRDRIVSASAIETMWLLLLLLATALGEEPSLSSDLDPAWEEVFASGVLHIGGPRAKRQVAIAKDEPDMEYQACVLPTGKPGHCRHLRHCLQDEFRNNFIKFADYLCIVNHTSVGACCPDDVKLGGPGGLAGDLPATAPSEAPNEAAIKVMRAENRGCGLSTRTAGRVVGARPANPREWPWMAQVTPEGEIQHCGGVLITDRHVLTAAHCTRRYKPEELYVKLGEYDMDRDNDSRTYNFQVVEKREHEHYEKSNFHHDIAILKLHRPAVFNTYVWPICLPPVGMNLAKESAVVIGWGTQWYGGPSSSVLMEVSLPIWEQRACVEAYTERVFETNLCAGGEGGKDSCQGDSGGPLMYQLASGRWATIGVVSWGVRCGEAQHPGIYTRVDAYLPWIIENARF